ncbi:MAG TPA: alpha/beta hydrolase [Geminicoccus sp.]|uniref:alpha/beta fold hydrolase n=1 Tax=Geminicoccus sp. TaxID=2024832 RepID=UPI002BFFA659|nr:alpha/beta hydrolase [Geminicoccus sp.]HWL71813.1 alpha/beta hydrolase [Geminicoccus sp.]
MSIKESSVSTSHGELKVRESAGTGTPVLMIHGNSSSGVVFRNQLLGPIGQRWRLIAPDLPGHGQSADALDPERTYSMEGYADAMAELLRLMGIGRVIVFGWSLGGHIGLEMIARVPGMIGLMITGTPPVAPSEVAEGFRPSPHMHLAGQEQFGPEDVENYARSTCGLPFEPLLRDVVARTDGRARRLMFEKFAAGTGDNQREIVAKAKLPIAVVNGIDEPFVNLRFVRGVRFGNLWRGQAIEIADSGHAPFWDRPQEFDRIFTEFLADMDGAP